MANHIDNLSNNPIGSPKWMQAVHAILTEHAALPHSQPQDHQREHPDVTATEVTERWAGNQGKAIGSTEQAEGRLVIAV